jgi:hypothetical protein
METRGYPDELSDDPAQRQKHPGRVFRVNSPPQGLVSVSLVFDEVIFYQRYFPPFPKVVPSITAMSR